MEKETAKSWERPWTTDEIREHSANWNLAGDAGLLNHLQQFSQNLLARTHATEVALDKLVEDLKTTSTSVQNATNTFLFLANTQFVENRVYDDDEKETPPEEKKDDIYPPKSKEEQEAEVFQNVKDALHKGLALLDTHFEAVEVPASDSEEEESSASVGRLVLKPKNPYLSRPLPYLIGSREFMEDDKVGLGEMSSDTEESPDQNVVQSSESDEEMEHDELIVSSKRPVALSSSDTENSEPESDRSETIAKQKKLKTSSSMGALDAEEEERDMFGQESPPEADEVVTVKGGVRSSFSDELSSKLVAAKPQTLPDGENEKDNMFVPSSETEDDTGLFGKASHSFTERQGLFDDLDDWQNTTDSLWKDKNVSSASNKHTAVKGPQSKNTVDTSHISDNQDDDMFAASKQPFNVPANIIQEAKKKESTPKSFTALKPVDDALFGQADEAEDLFSQKAKVTGSTSGNSALFGKDDLEDDDLFAVSSNVDSQPGPSRDPTKRKKLPGAVPVFNDVDLFGNLSPIAQQNSVEGNNTVGRNMVSGGSDLHQESGIGRSKDIISKRDRVSESQEGAKTSYENSSLFDSQKLLQNVVTSTKIADIGATKSSLFNTEMDSDSLFDNQRPTDEGTLNKNISGSKVSASSSLKPKTKKTVSLFDDSDSGEDELLFSSTSSTSSRSRRSQGSGDFLGNAVERRILSKKGLFEDNLLFGAVGKDEPDVDIFSSQSDSKCKGDSASKDNIFGGNDLISESSKSSTKVTSSLFDNIDDVDDIFAVPKIIVEKMQSHASNNSQANVGKLSLFSDNSNNVNDIFSNEDNVSKRSEGFMSVADKTSHTSDISGTSSKQKNSKQISGKTPSLFPIDQPPHISELRNEMESREVLKNTKPTIGQKPKVPIKPPPLTVSGQENSNSLQHTTISKIECNIENCQDIGVSDAKSQDVEKMNSVGTNDQEPESPSVIQERKGNNNQAVIFGIKPEPPRTLNIRKTTDIVFGSPNEDDLFESSLSDKSSVGKDSTEQPKNSNLSSSNFSKLLEGFSSNTVNSASTSSVSRGHSSNNSPASSKKQVSSTTVEKHSSNVREPQKISSPSKLRIDPRTLLPGARPPSMIVTSDGVVGFDKPAESTSTLHSAGKERVKIQVKRRPQTRRARQEALRASSVDYDNIDTALISQISNSKDDMQNSTVSSSASGTHLNTTTPKVFEPDSANKSSIVEKSTNSVLEKSPKSNTEGQSSISELDPLLPQNDAYKNVLSDCLSGNSNALSPLTDEEDLFAVPHELPFDDSNNKEMSNDGKNLFGGAPVLSPLDVKTGSDSFSSKSPLKMEADEDVTLSGKKDNELQSRLENPLKSDLFKGDDLGSIVTICPAAPDKSSTKNIPSAAEVEDTIVKHSDSKWLDHNVERATDNRGLFDEEDDKVVDDGSDEDLFSSVSKRPGKSVKKSEKDTFSEDIFQGSLLFSPDVDNTSENTLKENVQRKQSSSEDIIPTIEEKLPAQKVSDNPFPPTTSKSVSSEQSGSNESAVLFPKGISDFSQRNENDDLFASNVNTKDLKIASSLKSTDKVIANPSQDKVKSRVESLFGDDSIESDDLFGSSSVPKMSVSGSNRNFNPGSKTKDGKGMLFDDADDDDIFTVGLNKSQGPKRETLFPKEEHSSQNADKDADDLFSKRSSNSRNQGTKPSSAQKVQSFEDPLTVFNK